MPKVTKDGIPYEVFWKQILVMSFVRFRKTREKRELPARTPKDFSGAQKLRTFL